MVQHANTRKCHLSGPKRCRVNVFNATAAGQREGTNWSRRDEGEGIFGSIMSFGRKLVEKKRNQPSNPYFHSSFGRTSVVKADDETTGNKKTLDELEIPSK